MNLSEINSLYGFFFAALMSSLFAAMYLIIFRYAMKQRISIISVIIGATGAAAGAYFVETYLYQIYMSVFISLVIAAPVIEESLKFSGSAYGRRAGNGISVGIGFALAENMLYFHSFLSYPLMAMLMYVSLRGLTDPLFHGFTGGLDSKAWKGGKSILWIPASMGLHSLYNFTAVIFGIIPAFSMYVVIAVEVVLLLLGSWSLLRHREVKEPLKMEEVNSEIKTPVAKLDPKLDFSSIDSLKGSVDLVMHEYGFLKIASMLGFRNEYSRTNWLRTASLRDAKKGRNTAYIEIGPLGILAFSVIILAIGGVIWFLFLS